MAWLVLGVYTTPGGAYAGLIWLFKRRWKQQSGQDVVLQESYLGSGAQSRAIVDLLYTVLDPRIRYG